MNILIFGATGMVGQGVLRECLLDPQVDSVQTVGRSATGLEHSKLREIVHSDMWNYGSIEAALTGFDACFFCLGVSSNGMKREQYERITCGLTLAAADTLARLNPQMTFIYVSGAGTDSLERSKLAWARIKGRTENALLRLPFKAAYMFRPGFIEPLNGITSRTPFYRFLYRALRPLVPLLRSLMPNSILTTEQMGRAMLSVARHGAPKPVLEVADLRLLAP